MTILNNQTSRISKLRNIAEIDCSVLAENYFKQEIENILTYVPVEQNEESASHLGNLSEGLLKYFLKQYQKLVVEYDFSDDQSTQNFIENRIKNLETKITNLDNRAFDYRKCSFIFLAALTLVLNKHSLILESYNEPRFDLKVLADPKKKGLKLFLNKHRDKISGIYPVNDIGLIKSISPDFVALAQIETVDMGNIFSYDAKFSNDLINFASLRYPEVDRFKIIKIISGGKIGYYLVGENKNTYNINRGKVYSNNMETIKFKWDYFSTEEDKIPKLKYQVVFPEIDSTKSPFQNISNSLED